MTTERNEKCTKVSCMRTYLGQKVYHQHYHVDLTFGNPQMLENYKASSGLHSSSECYFLSVLLHQKITV